MTRQFSPPSQLPLSPEQIAYARTTNVALQSRLKLVEWENLITHITTRIKGEFNQDIVTRCPNKIANLDCVPKDSASVGAFTGTAAQAINAGMNTKVDFAALGAWEGGQHEQAYVPWWPKIRSLSAGKIDIDEARDRNGDLKGSSASGVTIGTGVDLGQQNDKYLVRLKKAGASDELIARLTPYLGKTRSNACAYLREHPLKITKKEVDLLDTEMKTYHLGEAKRQFDSAAIRLKSASIKRFEDLDAKEQTILLSRQYQSGNLNSLPNRTLMNALAEDSHELTLRALQLGAGGYPADGIFGKFDDNGQAVGRIPKERDYLEARK